MSAEAICDGCGVRAPMVHYYGSMGWHKPSDWFERTDKDGTQTACSRRCIELVAARTGKTAPASGLSFCEQVPARAARRLPIRLHHATGANPSAL